MAYLTIAATLALTLFPLLLAVAISSTHAVLAWRRRRRAAQPPFTTTLLPLPVDATA